MNKYSFSIDGFWFHLQKISDNSYQDHQGTIWIKKGNILQTETGGMIHKLPASGMISNKDKSLFERERGAFGNRERYMLDRFEMIHR